MFNMERAVQRWREDLERRSSLSPREVDELEDHLRARFDLELELDAGMDPARAFAIVRHELGQGPALAREFEKARKPTWRRWLVAGWALYAVWFVIPGKVLPMAEVYWLFVQPEVYWLFLKHGATLDVLGALLADVAMLLTLPLLLGIRKLPGRWLGGLLMAGGVWAFGNGVVDFYSVWSGYGHLALGPELVFWARPLAFVFAAVALWVGDRRRTPVEVQELTA